MSLELLLLATSWARRAFSFFRKLGALGLFLLGVGDSSFLFITEKRGAWAVFLAALMPPPFPFTAVVATASALQSARRELLIAVFTGRLIRFTAESMLALYFGRRLLRYLSSEFVEYFVYGLIAVAVIGSILTLRKWRRARSRQAALAN